MAPFTCSSSLATTGYPLAPIVICTVLGPIAEGDLRRSMLLSKDGLSVFPERPIALTILTIDLLALIGSFASKKLRHGEIPGLNGMLA